MPVTVIPKGPPGNLVWANFHSLFILIWKEDVMVEMSNMIDPMTFLSSRSFCDLYSLNLV